MPPPMQYPPPMQQYPPVQYYSHPQGYYNHPFPQGMVPAATVQPTPPLPTTPPPPPPPAPVIEPEMPEEPEFEEREELDEEEGNDLRALPEMLVPDEQASFVVRSKLATQITSALYRSGRTHLLEALDRALQLSGQPENLDYPVPSLHQTFVSNLSPAGRAADSSAESNQQWLWTSMLPLIKALPSLLTMECEAAGEVLELVHSSVQAQCALLSELTRQRRAAVLKAAAGDLDCSAITNTQLNTPIPISPGTLWGGMEKHVTKRRQAAPATSTRGGKINYILLALEKKGLSPGVIRTMQSSTRSVTGDQYNNYIKQFVDFALGRGLDPYNCKDIALPLEFLQHLVDEEQKPRHGKTHRGYSCIRIAVSALSKLLIFDGETFGSHPFTKTFMKGLKQLRPVNHRYVAQWDPAIILNKLKNKPFTTAEKMDLLLLGKKTLLLILLATSNRVHIAKALRVTPEYMSKSGSTMFFKLEKADLKQGSKSSKAPKPLKIKKFPHMSIDPVHYVETYIKRTKRVRGSIPELFLTTKGPVRAISTDTARNWVKDILRDCGINLDQFSPGSVRGASSSSASAFGATLDEILEAGGWSTKHVWQKWYCRPIIPEKRVLSDIYFPRD